MLLNRFAVVAALSALTITSGCGPVNGSNGGNGVTQLDAGDDGRAVTVPVSGRLSVSLDSNPTTGFGWSIATIDTSILENTDLEYVQDPAPPGVTGVGGTETWEFTARAVGTSTLRLEYSRSWETEEPPSRTFQVTVEVVPAA